MNDAELLRRFAEEQDETAFAELVRGKINLVYAAALRQVGGDAHLAQDVTQGVFIALACQATRLKRHPLLTGWLYTTTRNVASKAARGQRRWQRREAEATTMNLGGDHDAAAWRELRPALDESMHELRESDRAALLLRFFEGRSQAEVGAALGLSENAARMRIERALEKLRQRLAGRGITSTAAALGGGLASESLVAAPAGLALSVTTGALGCATAAGVSAVVSGGGVAAALSFMSTTKLIVAAAGTIALAGIAVFVGVERIRTRPPVVDPEVAELRMANAALRQESARLHSRLTQLAAERTAGEVARVSARAEGGDARTARNQWKLMAELHQAKLLQGSLPFITSSGRLHESVASAFDLTTREEKALHQLVDRARERIEALERANATMTQEGADKVVITVKPFPEAGGAVYDDLMRGIADVLGPERNEAFVSLAGDQVEKSLAMFGAADRTVTVTSQPLSEHSRYLARDVLVSGGSRYNNGRNFATREALTEYLGTITKQLPPDF